MSAHMKAHHIDPQHLYKVVITKPASKKVSYRLSPEHMKKLEAFLEKYSEDDEGPVAWEVLAKDRIEKHKKTGLVLRGMRYRESLSQKELAKASSVSQNEISKIENGKRTIGKKVAKRLAKALGIDYQLLIEDC